MFLSIRLQKFNIALQILNPLHHCLLITVATVIYNIYFNPISSPVFSIAIDLSSTAVFTLAHHLTFLNFLPILYGVLFTPLGLTLQHPLY